MKKSAFGAYIRSLRIQNDMTQAQLAEKLGVTDKAVSKWERDLSYPDITLFPRLADVLGVTANDLLNECIDEGQVPRLLQIFGMSHDIRTPLHIILGCASMAQIHRNDGEQLMRYLESIRISGEYLLNTIDLLMQMTYRDQEDITRLYHPATAEELGEYLNERAKARKSALQDYDFTGKRILVAEDIRVNQEIVAEILKQTGAEVEFADDGQMCFDKIASAEAGYYDLILMDLKMPKVNGAEAACMIRRLPEPEKAQIPVIAVSADVYEKDRRAAQEAGMDAFVEKPIFIDKLFETIKKILHQRRDELDHGAEEFIG